MSNSSAVHKSGSTATGTLFGWAFGDDARRDDTAYVQKLKEQALDNARNEASSKGLDVLIRSAAYTVIDSSDTPLDLDNAPGSLIVRCTVRVTGPGAEKQHAEGPMNG